MKKLNLITKNIKPQIIKDIEPFLNRLKETNYVEGIVLLGGLGKRDFLDVYSDIDIALFYDEKISPKYYLPFEFHLKKNNHNYEFNIHQLFFSEFKESDWDEGTREAYSNAIVFVDKKNRIEKLIASKIGFDPAGGYKRLIWIIQQYAWRGQIHSIRTCYRGFPEGGHQLLNECVDLLIEAIFLLNNQYMGHKKWVFAKISSFEVIPEEFEKNIRQAMLIREFSLEDIERRITHLDRIYLNIIRIAQLKYKNFPQDPYKYYFQNYYQKIKTTFSQEIKEEYTNKLDNEILEQLEGLLCFNLIFSKSKAINYINELINIGR